MRSVLHRGSQESGTATVSYTHLDVYKRQDLCLFDNDFVTGDVEAYRDTKVAKTILGGKVVYEG